MTDTILCIDIGTTSLKAALIPDNYKSVFVSRQVFVDSDGNHVAKEWMPALKKALEELHSKNPDYAIEAICVSGNGPTLVTENGFTLSWKETAENFCTDTKSLFIPRLSVMKNKYPEEWKNAKTVFSGPEYFLYRLTGRKLTILPEKRFETAYWNEEELKKCGFSEEERSKLPDFVKMGSFAGKVSQEAALFTGLFEGTFVFCGAPDFVVALLGTGTVFPGTLCDRAGSSEGVNLCTYEPIFSEKLRTLPSSVTGLWNISKLYSENHGKSDNTNDLNSKRISFFASAIDELRRAAASGGEFFPDSITITGGQALNEELVQKKATAANITVQIPVCIDAELIGDLMLTRIALGDYDDIEEAAMCLCKISKKIVPEKK